MRVEMEENVVITFETLFDILKREKERADLQKLEPTFFSDTVNYVKDKKKLLDVKVGTPFSQDERKKVERQIENIYKIIKELYERRERKIIMMAVDKSRTKTYLIDTSALLKEERVFYDALTSLLDTYREEILGSVVNERLPFLQALQKPSEDFKAAIELTNRTKLVRFTQPVPKFLGPELEEYGPFEGEDIANLPMEVADILINKGRVEEIKGE